jgi:hypothetical protein
MSPTPRFTRRHFAAGSLALAAGASFVLPAPGEAAATQNDSMNQPDGTYLFGSGEDLMPTVEVRWRIIRQTAKSWSEAPELARTLNFLTPVGEVPIIVDNLTTGISTYVPAHVAASAFGAEGDIQKRYVEQDQPAPYVAFELIVADQDNPDTIGTGTWLGSTDPFTAPRGRQEMEMAALVVNAVRNQQSKPLPDFDEDYPLIGYVHNQAVNVVHADDSVDVVRDGETIVLSAGDVIEYAGDSVMDHSSLYFARFVAQRSY